MSTIVFINPPLSPEKRYGELAQAGGVEPPFGLCYLAAVTRQQGLETYIIDAEALSLTKEETVERCLFKNPVYVGITATTPAINSAAKIAEALKEKKSTLPILLGGCHVSAIPEETLRDYPQFDMAVIDEGEETLRETIGRLERGLDVSSVKGLAIRDNSEVRLTGHRGFIKDMDSLPYPAFDLLPELKKYYRVSTQSVNRLPCVSLITSRGCFGKCTFCDTRVTGKLPRAHSAEYVVRMMRDFRENYGIKSIMFEDDNFLLFKKRLRRLSELLKKENLDVTWASTARVDTVDSEVLEIAKESGCWQVLYGVETGSQRILDFYRKNITLAKIEETLQLTKSKGLLTKGFLMMGNPLETDQTLEETTSFVKRLALDDISITFFTPFPGSEIYGEVDKYGTFHRNWEKMSCFDIVFVPNGLSKEMLQDYQKKALRQFYFRPRIIFSYLKRIRSMGQLKELLSSGITLLKYTKLWGVR